MLPSCLLIKPASSRCNARCGYCFYTDIAARRAEPDRGLMTEETADKIIGAVLERAAPGDSITFAFQGGEPTLAGLAFFAGFVRKTEALKRRGVRAFFTLQTNGLLLDGGWAGFLRKHNFLVGLSVDGEKDIHDRYRRLPGGGSAYDRAVRGLRLLQSRGVMVNILTVVHRDNAARPAATLESLKALGCRYLQFIPCLDPGDGPRGAMPWSLTPQMYGDFLCEIFDLWYRGWEKGDYVSVRLFEDWVHLMTGSPPSSCAVCGLCGGSLVIEADGSLYPCDFYTGDAWRLGGIGQASLADIYKSEKMRSFLARAARRPAECAGCPYGRLCRGGCPRDRTGENHMIHCEAYKRVFAHALDRLTAVARAEARAVISQRRT